MLPSLAFCGFIHFYSISSLREKGQESNHNNAPQSTSMPLSTPFRSNSRGTWDKDVKT